MESDQSKRNSPDYAKMVIERCRSGDVSLIHTVDFYTENGVNPSDVGTTLEEVFHYDRMRALNELQAIVVRYRQGKAKPYHCELGNEWLGLNFDDVAPREFGSTLKEVADILVTEAQTIVARLRGGKDMAFWGEGLEHYLYSSMGPFRRVTPRSIGMTVRDHALLRAAAYTRALANLQSYRSKRFGPGALLGFLGEVRRHRFAPEEFGMTQREFRKMKREAGRLRRQL